MLAALDPRPTGLDTDQPDLLVADERLKDADGIGAAADTRHHRIREATCLLEELRPGFAPDHRLEVAHHRRIGMWAKGGAEQIIRVRVGHPVPHRFVDRILQCAGARGDPADIGAQEPHAKDVGPLAPHIFDAHIDHAFQPEQRTDGCRRDAMLPRARLGDNAAFAHAPGEQPLPECVIDLVGTGVGEILAFEVDLGAATGGRKPIREGQGSGPPRIGAVQVVELRLERRVGNCGLVGVVQFKDRRHQRLRDEPPAVGAEAASAGQCWCLHGVLSILQSWHGGTFGCS